MSDTTNLLVFTSAQLAEILGSAWTDISIELEFYPAGRLPVDVDVEEDDGVAILQTICCK